MPAPIAARSFSGLLLTIALVQTTIAPVAIAQVAQCDLEWQPGAGVPGVQGTVQALVMWDRDGAGPESPRLVLGGSFASAGNTLAPNIVTWDPTTDEWAPVGHGLLGQNSNPITITSLAVLPGNLLVANGSWRWNGITWSNFGNQLATARATHRNGDAVAAYQQSYWGGSQLGYVYFATIERWNGASWAPIASFWPHSSTVTRLFTLHGGHFVAHGTFPGSLARFDGKAWRYLGSGTSGTPNSLIEDGSGALIVGGDFTTMGGQPANRIAQWNGTNWSALGSGTDNTIYACLELPEGDIIAGGSFTTAGGTAASGIARWDGSLWSPLGAGVAGRVEALALLPNGDLVAAGQFTTAGSVTANSVARWDGTSWAPLSSFAPAMNDQVLALEERHDGTLVAGGISGELTHFDGVAWSPFANTTPGMAWQWGVRTLEELPNGDLIAGGNFIAIDNTPARGIARWDGSAWSALGTGMSNTVAAVTSLPNGDVIAAGGFTVAGSVQANYIARWNGSSWSPLGSGTNGVIHALAVTPGGSVIAAGHFTSAGSNSANSIARFDGSQWTSLGSGMNLIVLTLLALPNGDVIAGGSFSSAGGAAATNIARWNGFAWSPLGTGIPGEVRTLTALPNGDLVAGGVFTHAGNVSARSLARWDGTAWSALDGGVNGPVNAVLFYGDNELAAGGGFTTAGSQASTYVARLATPCPAEVASIETACIGPAGPVTLTAAGQPWAGATLHTTATGFAPNVFAMVLLGFTSPNIPLSAIVPTGLPGCNQLASLEAVRLTLPQAGASSHAITIPNTTAFVGARLYHQFLQFEPGPQGQLASLSSSNGLALTIGAF